MLKVEYRKISELKPYPGNPRRMQKKMYEALKRSIKEFGLVDPLVVNPNNEVIGGNQRLAALKELGVEEVPVVVVDLPKSKERALNLALNKIQGEFDIKLLAEFVEDILPVDLELTGFDESEIYILDFKTNTDPSRKGALARDYLYPPFSVLDPRLKTWKELRAVFESGGRKKLLGNVSSNALNKMASNRGNIMASMNEGTSYVDPAICAVMYRWFMPSHGKRILNPMCGEVVPGYVAAVMGFEYVGTDVREDQVEWNNQVVQHFGLGHLARFLHVDARELNFDVVGGKPFDLVFYSPPYFGVEKYSNEQDDLSTYEDYKAYMEGMEKIIENSAKLLKENRFYIMLVGDVREVKGPDRGKLLNYCGDLVNIAEKYGLKYYNDIIYIEHFGTAAFRARRIFVTRKVVRVHQRLLVFYKGDLSQIKNEFPQDFSDDDMRDLLLKYGVDVVEPVDGTIDDLNDLA
jgi:16S rRNA G966 N2-methylase RsmD